jgi:hypothetical protein
MGIADAGTAARATPVKAAAPISEVAIFIFTLLKKEREERPLNSTVLCGNNFNLSERSFRTLKASLFRAAAAAPPAAWAVEAAGPPSRHWR